MISSDDVIKGFAVMHEAMRRNRGPSDSERLASIARGHRDGACLPPIIVSAGLERTLFDGYHRLHVARALGLLEIEAVEPGGVPFSLRLAELGHVSTQLLNHCRWSMAESQTHAELLRT